MSEEVKIYGTLVKGTVNKKLAYTDELFDKEYGNPSTEEYQKSQLQINEEINATVASIAADYLKSADINKLINNASYSNNTLTFTFKDETKIEVDLSDLAIDGMLADVLYLKENDTKPAYFPQDYSDGYPCFYFEWNIQEIVELVIEGVTTEVIQTSKKVIVVPTDSFIDINFDYTTDDDNKCYAVKKDTSNNLYVYVPWVTYSEGSNINITDDKIISSVVPKKELSIDYEGAAEVLDGTYYTYNGIINSLIIKFPYISDTSNAHGLAILFTTGNAPSIGYQIKNNLSIYIDYTPKKTIGFLIESNTTYEMTCTYVNGNWYVSAIPFET